MQDSLLDELVGALTEEGLVNPKSVREEAMRLYLNTHSTLKLDGAVALWRKEWVSSAKAAEIAGLTVPEFEELIAARGILRETEGKSRTEMDTKLHETLP